MNKMLGAAAAMLAITQAAWAQPVPDLRPPAEPASHAMGAALRHDLLFMAGAQLERERVVQGAPYCADAMHESVQTLADGNRIVHRQTSRQCRDAEGRTRQEVVSNGRRNVYLRDPVAREAWMLDGDAKQAVRLDARRAGPDPDPKMWDRLLGWSRDLRERIRPRPDTSALPPPPPPGVEVPPESVRIMIGGQRVAELPPPRPNQPPPGAFPGRLPGPRGLGSTNLLPADTIEGLKAEGRRTTWTIEAGKIGNEKPITIVNEVWRSPDLGITLRSRDADPLAGEDNYRVQNVARGEPDAALFKVPADFRKVDGPRMAMQLPPPVPAKP